MNQFAPILPELILTVSGIVLMMVAAFAVVKPRASVESRSSSPRPREVPAIRVFIYRSSRCGARTTGCEWNLPGWRVQPTTRFPLASIEMTIDS